LKLLTPESVSRFVKLGREIIKNLIDGHYFILSHISTYVIFLTFQDNAVSHTPQLQQNKLHDIGY